MWTKQRCFLSLAIGVMAVFFSLGVASAAISGTPYTTTDSSGTGTSTPPSINVFDWYTTPYLFTVFTNNNKDLTQTWTDPDGIARIITIPQPSAADTNSDQKRILNTYTSNPTVASEWTTIRKAGTWTWSEYASDATMDVKSGSFTVNAVPEPVSATLFLLGGVALVGRAIRKNKKLS